MGLLDFKCGDVVELDKYDCKYWIIGYKSEWTGDYSCYPFIESNIVHAIIGKEDIENSKFLFNYFKKTGKTEYDKYRHLPKGVKERFLKKREEIKQKIREMKND